MNAVEIEATISDLALPFDPAEFPYAFLEAFGNKTTTIKKLRSGASNKSDLGGVLQTKNIHIVVADPKLFRKPWWLSSQAQLPPALRLATSWQPMA